MRYKLYTGRYNPKTQQICVHENGAKIGHRLAFSDKGKDELRTDLQHPSGESHFKLVPRHRHGQRIHETASSSTIRIRRLAARPRSSSISLPESTDEHLEDVTSTAEDTKQERYKELLMRKEDCRRQLREKLNQLKAVCFEEAEITGELAADCPRHLGEPLPTFRRRVRTTYSLDPQLVNSSASGHEVMHLSAFVSMVDELPQHEHEQQTEIVALQLELQVLYNKSSALRRIHACARTKQLRKSSLAEQLACRDRVAVLKRQLNMMRNQVENAQVNLFKDADNASLCSQLSSCTMSCSDTPPSCSSRSSIPMSLTDASSIDEAHFSAVPQLRRKRVVQQFDSQLITASSCSTLSSRSHKSPSNLSDSLTRSWCSSSLMLFEMPTSVN